jgi:hypothetical protein
MVIVGQAAISFCRRLQNSVTQSPEPAAGLRPTGSTPIIMRVESKRCDSMPAKRPSGSWNAPHRQPQE